MFLVAPFMSKHFNFGMPIISIIVSHDINATQLKGRIVEILCTLECYNSAKWRDMNLKLYLNIHRDV